jgi:alkylmercury lyase
LTDQDWRIRLAIYRSFVANGHPPAYLDLAAQLGLPAEEVRLTYHRLHEGHAVFLDPGTDTIRMANPLSAIPTPYQVHVDGRRLWANCAWDSLGIPAMLHVDARIEAVSAWLGEPMIYTIEAGTLRTTGGMVHFPLPFCRWYDNLIHT